MDNAPAPPPPAVPSPPAAPGPAQPPKKGLHPLVWVAIGCGGLIFLAVVVVVVLMVLGYSTLRKAKEHGAFEITTDKGTMKVQSGAQVKLPDWLPPYPGGTPKASFTMKIPDGESVMCTWTTSDSPDKVQQFYQKALQDAGLEVATISTGGEAGGILTGRDKSEKRTAQVVVSVERGKTAVQVTCQTKSAKDE
jgi:hypothetical protein